MSLLEKETKGIFFPTSYDFVELQIGAMNGIQ